MDKVVLDGIEYIKAAVVAKQFHYTSDYVGQLCRAKKVDARLVGRTWFVNPLSLKEHKNNTHSKTAEPVKKESRPDDSASIVKIKRIDVNAPLKNKTAKSAAFNTNVLTSEVGSVEGYSAGISYHKDAETLLPNLNVKTKPVPEVANEIPVSEKRFLHIEPAAAKKLKIKSDSKKHVSFSSTELPEVSLSGNLRVSTYQDSVTQPFDNPIPNEIVSEVEPPSQPTKDSVVPVKIKKDPPEHRDLKKVYLTKNTPPSLGIRIMPLLATLFAIIVSAVLLSVVSEVTVTGLMSTSHLSVKFEYFLQLFVQ